tara:strand:- start:169 stop:870 length:702 start_codon:yes stop_codon:yes gene_type:complete
MIDTLRNVVYSSKEIRKILTYFSTKFQYTLLSFYKEKKVADLMKSIKNEVFFEWPPYEAYMIYSITRSQRELDGDMAEVGVYQGGSAKIICDVKRNRKLFLFDTFKGLPELSDIDTLFGKKHWKKNQFNDTSLEAVKDYLSSYENVQIIKGEFPKTADSIGDSKFSFVHLDVDLYRSTIECLKFFYPRLVKGGIILVHDYFADGIQKAFKEFRQSNKIQLIELTGSQCMIIKN